MQKITARLRKVWHTLNEEGYQLKLPLNLETIIPVDDSVRLLSQFVEAMDLTDLYSYMNGDYSSRSMELNWGKCEKDETVKEEIE